MKLVFKKYLEILQRPTCADVAGVGRWTYTVHKNVVDEEWIGVGGSSPLKCHGKYILGALDLYCPTRWTKIEWRAAPHTQLHVDLGHEPCQNCCQQMSEQMEGSATYPVAFRLETWTMPELLSADVREENEKFFSTIRWSIVKL